MESKVITPMKLGQGTVRFGDLEPFKEIVRQMKCAKLNFTVTKTTNGFVRKIHLDGVEVVSIAFVGRMWVYRYNKDYFGDEK